MLPAINNTVLVQCMTVLSAAFLALSGSARVLCAAKVQARLCISC
jgi:hypothetical protein